MPMKPSDDHVDLSKALGSAGDAAFNQHKADETEFDEGGSLPPGIENGIAELTMTKIGIYKDGDNKGKPFFMAMGTVLQPEEHYGRKIGGRTTKIGPEPLCDTPKATGKRKTLGDHISWAMNQARLLGLETHNMANLAQFQAGLELLNKANPKVQFSFRTWQGKPTKDYPNPRVNEVWGGVVSDDGAPSSAANGVADATGEVQDSQTVEETQTQENAPDEGLDLDNLVEQATAGDNTAIDQLTQLALEAGLSEQQVTDAPSWADVKEWIEGGEPPADGAAEEWKPEKGDHYMYKPPRAKNAVQCEVTTVNNTNQTVTVKNLANKLLYKEVAWSALQAE